MADVWSSSLYFNGPALFFSLKQSVFLWWIRKNIKPAFELTHQNYKEKCWLWFFGHISHWKRQAVLTAGTHLFGVYADLGIKKSDKSKCVTPWLKDNPIGCGVWINKKENLRVMGVPNWGI